MGLSLAIQVPYIDTHKVSEVSMKKRFFTLVELMIAISISSIIFVILMGLVLNVSLMVRDIYADQVLNNYARFARYVLINGAGDNGGFASAKGEFTKDNAGNISYQSLKGSAYTLGEDLVANNEINIDILDSVNFEGEKLLTPVIKVLDGDQLTIDNSNNTGFGQEIFIRSYLERKIWGRTYELGFLARSVGSK